MSVIAIGVPIGIKYDANSYTEEQYRLEKRSYLVVTLLSLGFFSRLMMIPLWFWILTSLIPSVPGAMCLLGVLQVNPIVSYSTTTLKFVLPAIYGYWLVLNFLDGKVPSQPFMKRKMLFLVPLGISVLLEVVFDTRFLLSIFPRQVGCCTSIFYEPSKRGIVDGSSWIWVVASFISLMMVLGYIFRCFILEKRLGDFVKEKSNRHIFEVILETLIILIIFALYIVALHVKISPLILNLPSNHCIFCLLQNSKTSLLSFIAVFCGLTLITIYFWIAHSSEYTYVRDVIKKELLLLLKYSGFMLIFGMVMLLKEILSNL